MPGKVPKYLPEEARDIYRVAYANAVARNDKQPEEVALKSVRLAYDERPPPEMWVKK